MAKICEEKNVKGNGSFERNLRWFNTSITQDNIRTHEKSMLQANDTCMYVSVVTLVRNTAYKDLLKICYLTLVTRCAEYSCVHERSRIVNKRVHYIGQISRVRSKLNTLEKIAIYTKLHREALCLKHIFYFLFFFFFIFYIDY